MLKGWKRPVAITVSAIALGNCISSRGGARAGVSGGPSEGELARCFEEQAKLLPFSGVVSLAGPGMRFARMAGTMDAEEQTPVTNTTQFRLASVQKVLTRIAIGKLLEQGRLDLGAPVSRYLTGLPAELGAVTLDQLLQHRSGVASFTRFGPETLDRLASASTARELVPLLVAEPLEFPPGERERYSNGGYWILGAVIEAVSNMSYGEYLQESVFRPLGMSGTGLTSGPGTAIRKTRMQPGQPPLPAPRPMRPPREPRGTPSGDGVSTAEDMMKLGRALLGDSLLKATTKARLFPARQGEPWRIGQSGGNIGTNTDFAVFPQSGLISVVLSNFDPPAGDAMGRVMRQAALGMGCRPLRAEEVPGPGGPRAGPGPGGRPRMEPGPPAQGGPRAGPGPGAAPPARQPQS